MKEEVSMLLEPVRVSLIQIGEFLPKLLLAAIVLIAGWLLAKAVRFGVLKALRALNLHVLAERAGVDGFLKQGGLRTDTVGILALLVYWLVLLAALIIAFNSLGLTYVTDLLHRVALFLPKVIIAVLIIAFGAYFARFIGGTIAAYCKSVELPDGELLGRIAQYAILAFVVLIALDQLDVGGAIVRQSFLIILAGLVLALALAFGIGGQRRAADLLERWWPRERGRDPQDPPG
jgi:hypothetical protein